MDRVAKPETVKPAPLRAELASWSARRIVEGLAQRQITAEAVTRSCLDRIAERDELIQAWVAINPECAIAQARDIDKADQSGWLRGVPIGVKDVIDTFDLPTAYGSDIYASHQPRIDAASVALLREAGAVIPGKTATAEFANVTACATRNPCNPGYSPGGSSSGSAAAVADSMVPLALGTQTAGSTIRPAAYCGIVGYKPSFGLVTRAGIKSTSESLDTAGGFARSVGDMGVLAASLLGDSGMLRTENSTPPRIGFLRTSFWNRISTDSRAAIEAAVRRLSAAGAQLTDLASDHGLARLVDIHDSIMSFEIYRALSHERRHDRERISPALLEVLKTGASISCDTYLAQLEERRRAAIDVDRLFDRQDVLLTPSALGEAPRFGEGSGDPLFCRAWTLLGLPCIGLPCGTGVQGLPLGFQLVGRYAQDRRLLQIADWVETQLKDHEYSG